MPTDKSWADTDYKLAYDTKSVLQMRQILNFLRRKCDDATIEAYAAKYLALLPTMIRKKTVDLGYRMLRLEKSG
jgi:zinc protease